MALVERYEPAIRRAVRVKLRDPRLRRLVETVDIDLVDLARRRMTPEECELLERRGAGLGWAEIAVTGELLGDPLPHMKEIVEASFRPDGNAVLTRSRDITVRIW